MDENGGMEYNFKNFSTALSNYLAALRDLMGTDKNNMMVQLCAYKHMLSDFDNWLDEDFIAQWLSADDTTDIEARKKEILENRPTRPSPTPISTRRPSSSVPTRSRRPTSPRPCLTRRWLTSSAHSAPSIQARS